MNILNIFNRIKGGLNTDSRTLLQKLVDAAKNGSADNAVSLLSAREKPDNPSAIPYTPEAVRADFSAVRQCMISEHPADNELATLLAAA